MFCKKGNPVLKMQGLGTELMWFMQGEENGSGFSFSFSLVIYIGFLK